MAIKRAKIIKMRLDELAAVDVGAQEAQGTVVLKRGRTEQPPSETKKRSALTSAELGHTHVLYGIDDSMAGTTSYESTYSPDMNHDRYCSGHSHPWVRGEDGAITLGEAMGHSHAVGVMSAALAKSAVAPTTNRTEPVTPINKSTQATPTSKVDTMKLVVLSEAQKAHHDTLSATDAELFLAKSSSEREADVEKARASNTVVFKGEITGIEVRKSHGDFARKMAEVAEKNAEAAKKATESAEIEKAARESETYKARAKSELGNLAGTEAIKSKVLQSIDGRIVPYTTEERDEALKMLKGANEIAKSQLRAPGHNGADGTDVGAPNGDALTEFNAGVKKFAETNGIKDEGLALEKFLGTTEGLVLKKKYDATRAYGR